MHKHTQGTCIKGLKSKLLPPGLYSAQAYYHHHHPSPLGLGTQLKAYRWGGQTGEGFLYLSTIFTSCITSILSPADPLQSDYFAFPI